MDVNAIVSVIGSVGFPIVACVAMAWFYATQFKDFQSMVDKNNLLTEELVNLLKEESDEADLRELR